jgi:hypothetical protein
MGEVIIVGFWICGVIIIGGIADLVESFFFKD